MFCSVPISTAFQSQFTLLPKGHNTLHNTSQALRGGYREVPHSPAITHNLCRLDLNCFQLSPGAQGNHYIDDNSLWGHAFDTGIQDTQIQTQRSPHKKGWAIALHRMQGPASSVKFLKITWSSVGYSSPENVKTQLIILSTSIIQKECPGSFRLF